MPDFGSNTSGFDNFSLLAPLGIAEEDPEFFAENFTRMRDDLGYSKKGGLIQGKADGGAIGCMSMMNCGAAPAGMCAPQCMNCTPMTTNTGLGGVKSLGQALGCVSTQYRGALPYKG